ncbi:MAG: ethanolamine ammonia-lyase reactivating factor EutA [Fluviicola sp.]|jgi:exopolyphosphatase/guanosine-5'-triphosphate,3'-diphosphate pyrophosphatase|nr:ethanolamine ammonia-lyase reactivating factor EutA [Fluviicola sp.]
MRYGAIDIGTNAARLLVGEVTTENGHSFVKKISYTRIPLRLGEEVFEDGKISVKKAEHFSKTIKAFRLISEIFEVKELRACATSAMREASNGKEIQKLIADQTGVEIDVISGNEEADLIFGTFFLMDFDKTMPFVVIDVGGGSTEVSVFENGERLASKSFQIGTIRLLKGKVNEDIWKEIHDWLALHVEIKTVHQIFATGGNINKVHKMLGAQHMETISVKKIKELRDEIDELSLSHRVEKYQLKPDRADVIVPAMDIYLYIMKELKCKNIIVPKIGLSDGMIYDMYLKRNKKI